MLHRFPRRFATGAALLALAAVTAAGCGSSSKDDAKGSAQKAHLTLVAYSTPREAYAQLIKDFQKTDAGKGASFTESYGASGDQSRAVDGGLPADVVNFALAPDVDRLVKDDIVADDWSKADNDGFVTNSIVVWVVRKGNPKGIKSWDDLVKPGVKVITANPFTSGGARWNVMAAYGAQIKQGKSPDEALDYLNKLFHNVPVQDKSAREALGTFTGGTGDVLLSYENEAIAAKDKGEDIEYIVPDQTILIQMPIAVTKDSKESKAADAFRDFLWTKDAQETWAKFGYRPVLDDVLKEHADEFPTPPTLFTIDDLGGWGKLKDEFFDPTKGKLVKVEQELGVPTEK